uniref:Serine proteinase inhibitor, KU family protein n=1 Tax=uncultured marine thaumarchaeote AD1000_12_H07 TaxID=1455891 RepID=A0A075FJS4_9ARCH|nr:Serine proteinase inhibitor, KU family protein [uncultured marine thaumarchaeote AD1000_12_H07]
MKIGMRRLHLFIVLFVTCSLLFHAPLPEASAAAGDITAVKTQSEGNNLEYDTDSGTFNSLVQVDSDTYALAYGNQQDDDGFIATFTISSDGTTITEVGSLEHDTDHGLYNSLVQVDSDTYALAYAGTAFDGFISTFTISSDGTTITEVGSLEHDTDKGFWNSLVQVDSDTYALAYQGAGDDGFIATFTISSDGTTITEVDSLEHDTGKGSHNSLVQVDSDTYALAYAGTDDDGFISTFTIDSDGTITAVKTQSEGNNLEHDTANGSHTSLVQVDSDTYALAYMNNTDSAKGEGVISTFTISSDGTTITEVASLEHDTDIALHNSLVQVDSDTYALAYTGTASDGFISTFTISSDGTTITEVASLEHDTVRGFYNSLVQVDSDTHALAYDGDGVASISTFDIATSMPHQVGTVSTTSSGELSWTAPTAGASDITDYTIQYSTDDSNWTTFDDGVTTGTTATVTGLTSGTTYYFRVAAVNSSGTGDFSSSSSVVMGPTVTITSSSGDSGSSISVGIITYTVVFSESVTDFTIYDITLSGSANARVNNFAGSGTTYTFDVVRGSDGTVLVSIAEGAATDANGNGNVVSNEYIFSVSWNPLPKATSTCTRHVILGNCGTIAINNDEYRIIDTWTNVPTTEVLVGQPVTVTLSTPHNPTYTKIHFASVHTEVFSIPANFDQSVHIDYSVLSGNHHVSDHVSQSQLFQAAGATHRIVQDPNVKNLEMFEVVFTMIFAKPMDTSHVVVETENKYGIPETLYLIDALKVSNSIVETLTLEQESKFELIYEPGLEVDPEQSVYTMSIDPESEMDPEPEIKMDPEPEIEMDPEPEQTKKEKSKRPR